MVGIVHIQDLRYCPYLDRYTSPLIANNIPYDCIWWERFAPPKDSLPPQVERAEQRHVFTMPSELARNPALKLGDFVRYGQFVSKVIKERRYDKLIILTTMTGIILWKLLLGDYRNRYVFDIRDFSYEHILPFKHLEARLIDAASFTCISSEGFLEFLPKGRPYVLADNFTDTDIGAAKGSRFTKKSKGVPLTLTYAGFIRYFQENRKILDCLRNDERFMLCYHGTGADYDKLVAYQREFDVKNLQITGYFDHQRDKSALCEKADMLNNFYPYTLEIQRLATTNKMYDGLIYRRPQLVSRHTFSETLVNRWQIGCALDIGDPRFGDHLYEYYHQVDPEAFMKAADAAKAEVVQRDHLYRQRVSAFITA